MSLLATSLDLCVNSVVVMFSFNEFETGCAWLSRMVFAIAVLLRVACVALIVSCYMILAYCDLVICLLICFTFCLFGCFGLLVCIVVCGLRSLVVDCVAFGWVFTWFWGDCVCVCGV